MDKCYKLTNISHITKKNKAGQPSPITLQKGDKILLPPKFFTVLQAHEVDQVILDWTTGSEPLAKLEEHTNPLELREEMDRQKRAEETRKMLNQPDVLKGVKASEGMADTSVPMAEESSLIEAAEGVTNPFEVVAKSDTTAIPEAHRSDMQNIIDLT